MGKLYLSQAYPGFIRPCQKSGNPFQALPEGLTDFQDWRAIEFNGPLRALILPDVHVPYHDRAALSLALEHGLRHKADFILFNGDFGDFFAVSHWEKDPRERDFQNEILTMREVLQVIRDSFPKAKLVWKDGNHEDRWDRYMKVRAPELLGVDEFTIPSILKFDELKIQHVSEMRPVRIGSLNVIHGHEYKGGGIASNPVNPARGFYLRGKVNCIGSHYHQTSQHSEKNLEGKVVSTWSTGCLSDLHPAYRPINSWNTGFSFVTVDRDGAFEVENRKILHNKVY